MSTVVIITFGCHMRVQDLSAQIFTMIVNDWKSLAIVIKSSNLYIGRVYGSTNGRQWNTGLDLKLKFTMLSITFLKKKG